MTRPSSVLSFALLAIAVWVFPACSDDNNTKKDLSSKIEAGGGDATHDALPDKHRDSGPPADSAPTATITGWLEDETGSKLAGEDLIVCNNDSCLTGTTGSTGSFSISVDTASTYMVHATERTIGAKHYADAMFPLVISASDISSRKQFDLGRIALPLLGTAVTLDIKTGGALTLGGGVILKVAANSTTLPPLTTKANIAVALIKNADIHARLLASQSGSPTPVAAFAFIPFETTFSTPVSFELPCTGLTSGSSLEFYGANTKTGTLELQGEATVSSSSTCAMTDVSGKGITGLTWLLFYSK